MWGEASNTLLSRAEEAAVMAPAVAVAAAAAAAAAAATAVMYGGTL